MEGSSPLAFARPPPMPSQWSFHQNEHQAYNPNLLGPSYMPQTFNFRDTNTATQRDYFNIKAIRESSPTSGLAVDLAQNFHIDQSPRVPTPRRCLFTGGLLDLAIRPAAVTPPILTSSPGPDLDMDGTPLPHKRPHQPPVFQIDSCPTPDITPYLDENPLDLPSSVPSSAALVRSFSQPVPSLQLESPKPRRPQLPAPRPTLRKANSSNIIAPRPIPLQAPFQFLAPPKCVLETFAESPPSDKVPNTAPLASTMMGSSILANLSFVQNGSPSGPARPPSRAQRQRFRRTQSMQCNNSYKPMRQEKRSCTDSSRASSVSLEMDISHRHRLPHFMPADDTDSLPRLTQETMIDVLAGVYDEAGAKPTIIDCRFEYEYEGGHIVGATNFNDKEELARKLFDDAAASGKIIIFHCEYSAHRAPMMAKYIRQRDRTVNQDFYPRLTYPEVYILDGGYSAFFKTHPSLCFPQAYVEMDAVEHVGACERGMANVKRTRAKLSRAQTYAFGQGQNAFALPHPGGNPTSASVMNTFNGSPMQFNGSPMESSMRSIRASISIDAMDIDFSSPTVQVASSILNRGLAVPRRIDSY